MVCTFVHPPIPSSLSARDVHRVQRQLQCVSRGRDGVSQCYAVEATKQKDIRAYIPDCCLSQSPNCEASIGLWSGVVLLAYRGDWVRECSQYMILYNSSAAPFVHCLAENSASGVSVRYTLSPFCFHIEDTRGTKQPLSSCITLSTHVVNCRHSKFFCFEEKIS